MNSHYKRLSLGERNSIENYLDQNKSARYIAKPLERSTSTITYEVKQNLLLSRWKYKGIPAREIFTNYSIDKIYPKLQKPMPNRWQVPRDFVIHICINRRLKAKKS